MANNIAMPNQQVPIGSRPSEFGYSDGNELLDASVGVGKNLANTFASSLKKRREDIAQGRAAHMQEAAALAQGNNELLKGAMDFATKFMMANVNKDNLSELATNYPDATKITTGSKKASMKRSPGAAAQPSAVTPPAPTPRVRKTESRVSTLANGTRVRTTVPIGTPGIEDLHKVTLQGHETSAPSTPARAKATTAKTTSRAAAPKPPVAKTTPKAPASKAPAKNPAARKPRVK